jgi:hypothetical protein
VADREEGTEGADQPTVLTVGGRRRPHVGPIEAEGAGWPSVGGVSERVAVPNGADQPTVLAVGGRRRAHVGPIEAEGAG